MSILMRFRTFQYVFVADIIQMYRQILIHPSQTRFQRILWRDDVSLDIKAYELNTITYGTASASYLATRCLKHLAELAGEKYPVGSAITLRDFYMDDLLTGADTIEDARTIRDETIALLRSGGFELSKWASNSRELLFELPDQDSGAVTISGGTDSRVLGIHWNKLLDTFYFTYEASEVSDEVSKRVILSEISRLFDPLGLLGPVIVLAKLILQDLWQSGTHWDESVPQDIYSRWVMFKSRLININQIKIPRCIKFAVVPQAIQIHGFSDASQHAYGACVYVRTELNNREFRSELLCSKSRVAPLKAISLPRLELSAALLLARLIDKIKSSFDLSSMQTYLWSDSTITLNWISSSSRKRSVFVANRVGEIQHLTEISSWCHVSSSNNPADILSRGLDPLELEDSILWWHGPTFLMTSQEHWPVSSFILSESDLPEQRVLAVAIETPASSLVEELLSKHSSLVKACRVLAYCLRFTKARHSRAASRFVTPQEIRVARNVLSQIVQRQVFALEYGALCKGKDIDKTSSLLSLAPFVHTDGLIRVGGRLKNWNLDFETCRPILLPRNHILTRRIIEQEHTRIAHGGVQSTMASIRQRYWPLSLRSTTRKIIRSCITCFKAKLLQSEAKMASLPAERVSVSRPFAHCGVDYRSIHATRV